MLSVVIQMLKCFQVWNLAGGKKNKTHQEVILFLNELCKQAQYKEPSSLIHSS